MWEMILGFLGGPIAKAIVDAYSKKLDAQGSHEAKVAELAGREISVEQRELELAYALRTSQIGHWYEPEHLAAYILVAYVGKVFLYDAALGLGSTDAVHGDVGAWGGLIMAFLFGKRGLENVARILKS